MVDFEAHHPTPFFIRSCLVLCLLIVQKGLKVVTFLFITKRLIFVIQVFHKFKIPYVLLGMAIALYLTNLFSWEACSARLLNRIFVGRDIENIVHCFLVVKPYRLFT